jgi:DNA-binding MarR family transcriptional regulator
MPGRLLLNPWPRDALVFAAALERAGRRLLIARRGLSAGYGLTVAEWRMLRAVGEGPCGFSVAALARRIGTTRQNAHRAASALQRLGWLQLAPRTRDRRILVVSLTGVGERWLAALDSAMRDLLLEVTSDLSRQRLELMTDALVRVSRRLQACRTIVRASKRQRRKPHSRKSRNLC